MTVLPQPEFIRESVTVWDWTLGDAIHAVHLSGIELTNAVPVNGCAILFHVVRDVDDNLISPASLIKHQYPSPAGLISQLTSIKGPGYTFSRVPLKTFPNDLMTPSALISTSSVVRW